VWRNILRLVVNADKTCYYPLLAPYVFVQMLFCLAA
jgi:hypothetical protein